jgi:3-deoxy-7-phosphoheptulonate synthase
MDRLQDLNILRSEVLPTPHKLKAQLAVSDAAAATVAKSRHGIEAILDGTDKRLMVIVGPCSIHDIHAAAEYASHLRDLASEVGDTMMIAMRVYFEKPRTTVGWKGFINDPYLDDSFQVDVGLHQARKLLIDLAELGLPAATEALDPMTPQYISDLIAWSAIGARTTESQTHREMSSGLSMPVGFKNGTDGSIQSAVNALKSVSSPHAFVGINDDGQVAVFHTTGNKYGHVVLRGGKDGPNYHPEAIEACTSALAANGLSTKLVVDCSHGNSGKDPARQEGVFADCIEQVCLGNTSIVGLMLESNLKWGNQKCADPADLEYGVSITDACIDWDATKRIIRAAHQRLLQR